MAKRTGTRSDTAEHEARSVAEENGWIVSTRYTDGIADVCYSRTGHRIVAVFGRAGRVQDITRLDSANVIREFIARHDTGKRAMLLDMLRAERLT